jgi:uncharacterized repeat protein (TIGR03803 family)
VNPTPPTGLTATFANGVITLFWQKSAGATSYVVSRGLALGGKGSVVTVGNVTDNGWVDTQFSRGQTYVYSVMALGNGLTAGPSNTAQVTVPAQDGTIPMGSPLILSDGTIAGTTSDGGAGGVGAVFFLSPSGTMSTFGFPAPDALGINAYGANPTSALTLGSDGFLYGICASGGPAGTGTIFKINASGAFQAVTADTTSDLTLMSNGNLYGVASSSGDNGVGAIQSLTTSGTLTTIASLPGFADPLLSNIVGANPSTPLTLGPGGLMYGSAATGGANGYGAIFKVDTLGSITCLYSFNSIDSGLAPDAEEPVGRLVVGTDGSIYGVAESGGTGSAGCVYKIDSSGLYSVIYNLPGPDANGLQLDGATPKGIVFGPNGVLYGVTSEGGAYGTGTVFSLTTGGSHQVLYSFAEPDGVSPMSPPILAADGFLYGTTMAGGLYGQGTLYKISTSGTLTTLYSFGGA